MSEIRSKASIAFAKAKKMLADSKSDNFSTTCCGDTFNCHAEYRVHANEIHNLNAKLCLRCATYYSGNTENHIHQYHSVIFDEAKA